MVRSIGYAGPHEGDEVGMTVRFRHIRFPVPGARDLAAALLRRRFSVLEACLLVLLCATLLMVGAWWMAIALPLAAIAVDAAASTRTRTLVRSWRATRARRRALNDPARQAERQRALADHLTGLTQQADYAWRAYMADAVTGKKQSIINERPAPKVQPLQRLVDLAGEAEPYAIALETDDAAGQARLNVPPETSFAPDTLSPTMMNLNAASLAQAQAEGAARAQRRHRRAVEHAAEFGPTLLFAEQAAAALAAPASDDPARPRWRPWRRRDRIDDTAEDSPAIG